MGKRAQRARRRTAAERIQRRQARATTVNSHRAEFERERAAFFRMLRLGQQFRRPAPPATWEAE